VAGSLPGVADETRRRLGRPPASDSAKTRRRILDVAREMFAELGWELTTNKDVATKAGVTSAALYHYFDAKADMYVAVFDDVEGVVVEQLGGAMEQATTFRGQFEAVLEAAHRLNGADPSLARYLASARVDLRRHPEVRAALGHRPGVGEQLVARLVATGVATGEIAPADREAAAAYVRLTLSGLSDAVSDDDRQHRTAVDAILAALDGRLFRGAASSGHAPAPRQP
jgi:AcrR family transcriptional regulator